MTLHPERGTNCRERQRSNRDLRKLQGCRSRIEVYPQLCNIRFNPRCSAVPRKNDIHLVQIECLDSVEIANTVDLEQET